MSFRDSLFFQVLRPLVLGGVRINPVLRQLDAKPSEHVLDAGCGFGYLVKHFKTCYYTGVDSDPGRIDWAKSHIGEHKKRKFIAADICHTQLPAKSFDKAVAFGLLHHLPDDVAARCVRELSRLVKGNIVFLDGVYSDYHVINNILCKYDQGKYVRRSSEYVSLVSPHVKSVKSSFYHAYSGIAKYFMMTCEAAP